MYWIVAYCSYLGLGWVLFTCGFSWSVMLVVLVLLCGFSCRFSCACFFLLVFVFGGRFTVFVLRFRLRFRGVCLVGFLWNTGDWLE